MPLSVIDSNSNVIVSTIVSTAHSLDLHVIDSRLGHVSISKMRHKSTYNEFSLDDFICNTCQVSKCYRLPFEDNNHAFVHCFDLLHVDLWDPYAGASYVLTIVDDSSKAHGLICLITKLLFIPILPILYNMFTLNLVSFQKSIEQIIALNLSKINVLLSSLNLVLFTKEPYLIPHSNMGLLRENILFF